MKVVIATKNPHKLEGISLAFRDFFPKDDIQISSIKVESGVDEQPFNDNVYLGARNRVENAQKVTKTYDFIISCESGIIEQFGNFFNVQIVYIIDSSKKEAWGISQGFQIPNKYIPKIKETNLKTLFDEIFNEHGGISMLSYGQLSRSKLIYEGTKMALSGFNWL